MAKSLARQNVDKLRQWVTLSEFGNTSATVDNTTAFRDAIAAVQIGGTIDFGSGPWRMNALIDKFVRCCGSGGLAPTITAYDPAGDVFAIAVNNGSWALQAVFEDMDLRGSGITGGDGVVFAGQPWATLIAYAVNRVVVDTNSVYRCIVAHTSGTFATDFAAGKWVLVSTYPAYAGRTEFTRVLFNDFNRCVRKPFGNIGNVFKHCTFGTANFHMHAVSVATMHAGCDVYTNMCHFTGAVLASLLYDSAFLGTGQLTVRDAIMELNPGFVFFINNFLSVDQAPSILIDSVWNENNCTGGVNVLGTPMFGYLRNTGLINIKNTRLTSYTLINSTVHMDECHSGVTDPFTRSIDSASSMRLSNHHDCGGSIPDAMVSSVSGMDVGPGNFRGAVWMPSPKKISHAYQSNILYSQCFTSPVTFTATTTVIADGSIFGARGRLSYNANQTVAGSACTIGKFVVGRVTLAHVSGTAAYITFYGGTVLGSLGSPSNTTLKTFALYAQADAASAFGLYLTPTGATVTDIAGVEILQFDTEQEAVNFINAGEFAALGGNVPRVTYGTAAPVTGTWNVGDDRINSVPVVGQPIGWKCTVAGTPGTWVALANL